MQHTCEIRYGMNCLGIPVFPRKVRIKDAIHKINLKFQLFRFSRSILRKHEYFSPFVVN